MHRQLRKILLVAASLTTLSANAFEVGHDSDWIDVMKDDTVRSYVPKSSVFKEDNRVKGLMATYTTDGKNTLNFYSLSIPNRVCDDESGDIFVSSPTIKLFSSIEAVNFKNPAALSQTVKAICNQASL